MNIRQEIIFGIKAVAEAIRADRTIDSILVKAESRSASLNELIDESRTAGIPVRYVPRQKLDSITRKNHQGIIAWLSPVDYHLLSNLLPEAFEKGNEPLVIVLDGISDVRNFGAIVRSADCLGATAIVIPERGSAKIGGDAVKTSAGALMHFPVCREKNLSKAVRFMKDSGLKVVGASGESEITVHDTDLSGPLTIIMGAEDRGISHELISQCDVLVRIPMTGRVESLNVSVAAGILLYEVNRQRKK